MSPLVAVSRERTVLGPGAQPGSFRGLEAVQATSWAARSRSGGWWCGGVGVPSPRWCNGFISLTVVCVFLRVAVARAGNHAGLPSQQ